MCKDTLLSVNRGIVAGSDPLSDRVSDFGPDRVVY